MNKCVVQSCAVSICAFVLLGAASISVSQTAQPARKEWTAPPTFAEDDTEGLVMSLSDQVRFAWKRKVFWKEVTGTYY